MDPTMDPLMTREFSSASLPSAVAWAGAGSAVLAGLSNTLNQSIETILMNHWSVAVHWLTDVVPIAFTFFAVAAATLLSTAAAVSDSLHPHIRLVAIACLVVGIGFAMIAWFLPGPAWVTAWIDMIGRVVILVGIELAVFLILRAVWRKHWSADVERVRSLVIPSQIPRTDAEEAL